jgi:hypothetical protein
MDQTTTENNSLTILNRASRFYKKFERRQKVKAYIQQKKASRIVDIMKNIMNEIIF